MFNRPSRTHMYLSRQSNRQSTQFYVDGIFFTAKLKVFLLIDIFSTNAVFIFAVLELSAIITDQGQPS